MTNNLSQYNWNQETGEIFRLPDFKSLSDFINTHAYFTKDQDFRYDIEQKLFKGFVSIVENFATTKSKVTLYKCTYELNEQSQNFFFENSLGKVFYIRPQQILEIFNTILTYIEENCFKDDVPLRQMSEEEDDHYWDLMIKDKTEAKEFRSKFYTSLHLDSEEDILDICNFKIIGAFKNAFYHKISLSNYCGDENLRDEIINYIDTNENFKNIVRI